MTKTSKPDFVKSLGYIKCYSLRSPRPIKSPNNSIGYNCQKIFSWSRKFCKIIGLKGNPNFQGILNWIIQILHCYCRKQHKNIENSRIIEQDVAISICLLRLALPLPSSTAGYFQFLDTVLNVTSDHSCCI